MTEVPEQHQPDRPHKRARLPAQTPKAVLNAPHGTLAGFQTWRCRCMFCLSARAARAATTVTIGPGAATASQIGKPHGR